MLNIAEIWEKERDRRFLWIPVLFGLGIGIYFALPFEPSFWGTPIVLELLLVTAYIQRYNPVWRTIVFCLLIVWLGFADIQLTTMYRQKQFSPPLSGPLYLRGQVLATDINSLGRRRIVFGNLENLFGDKLKGRYRLTIMNDKKYFEIGKCLELVAEVSPLMKANLVGGYQPDRRLFFDGINAGGYVLSSVYEIDCPQPINPLIQKIEQWRHRIKQAVSDNLSPEVAGVATAIIIGDKDLINNDLINNYRIAGLAHFLSISGLHISMIAGLTFFLVRWLSALFPYFALNYNLKKLAAWVAIAVSTIYLAISGSAVPTQRAYIMTILVLGAVLCERRAISMRTVALSAMLILAVSPYMLINISFQFSFAAVIALVAFYEVWSAKLKSFNRYNPQSGRLSRAVRILLAYIGGILIADCVAGLATLPLAIYHFNQLVLYSSITNLLAGPLIGLVIMPAVLLFLVTLPLGWGDWPLLVAGKGIAMVNYITTIISAWPGALLKVMSFPQWGILLIVGGGLWLCLWREKWRNWGWLLILGGSLSLLTVKVPDMIVADGGATIAVKGNDGKLRILDGGNKWIKQNWAEKLATVIADDKDSVSRPEVGHIDFERNIGVSIYGQKIQTVRDYIGFRPWNK